MKTLCLLTAGVLASAGFAGCQTDSIRAWTLPPPVTQASPTTSCTGATANGTTVVTLYNFAVDASGQRSVMVSADPANIQTGCWNLTWIISSGSFTFTPPGVVFTTSFPGGQAPGFPPTYTVFIADAASPQSWKYNINVQAPTPGGGTQKWTCDPRVVATGAKGPVPTDPTDPTAQLAAVESTRAASIATPAKVLCSPA